MCSRGVDYKMSQEYFGQGATEYVRSILAQEKPRRIFIVRGKNSYQRSQAEEKLGPLLKKYAVTSFSDFSANARIEDVEKGITLFREHQCDFMIAVGGGSALDLAKGIALLTDHPEKAENYVLKKAALHSRMIPLLAIPTTAGTGSEATHFAAIYINKTKHSLAHPSLIPDYAIIDPSLTFSLPSYQTACTGMDALSQAIESYWSIHSTDKSKQYARQALALALTHLEKAVNNPDPESRIAMAKAAHLAGKAINISFTTACHAISYPFTSYFKVPHGHAVALTLAEMVTYNAARGAEDCQDKRGPTYVQQMFEEIYLLFGVSSAPQVQQRLEKLMDQLHLSRKLRQLGITISGMEQIIKNVNPERMTNNPRKITEQNLRSILQKIY